MTLDTATTARVRTELNSSVLSDVIDALGHLHQVMDTDIRPLDDSATVFGRARTAKIVDASGVARPENPYELTITTMDSLLPGDVIVRACEPKARGACWGELLTTAAMARGAVGLVTDGLIRDVQLIREVGFPVFTRGISPVDGGGRQEMVAADVDVQCGGVLVRPGDYLFADVDGVVVIPSEILDVAISAAFKKVEGENATRDELLAGKSLADVYAKYGIL